MAMISVLILTKNEEQNILRCLDSVAWSDDIIVLDDGSTDKTAEMARQRGARVVVHSAGSELAQRTYSLTQLEFKHPWIYNPDADEVTPVALRDEMLNVVKDVSRSEVAFRVRFKNMFMGKWLKHSSLYPTWVVRLFRPDRVSLRREINLNYLIDGPEGRLSNHFEHYSFNKGLTEWFAKHNRYSELEAKEALSELREGRVDWLGLLSISDVARRRRASKNLAWRLPARCILIFLYLLIIRRGFLDGRAGIIFCALRGIYESMIDLKLLELRRRESGLEL